jgi:hypothetical protein
MFRDIPDTRALSNSPSSGWKYDGFKTSRKLKVLQKIISHLHHPSSKIRKLCLESIDVFLLCAIDLEVLSKGFPTFFDLGNPEIHMISNATPTIKVAKARSRNHKTKILCVRILLRLSEWNSVQKN